MAQPENAGRRSNYACPHCGARYAFSIHRVPARERDKALCACCRKVMAEWNNTVVPTFELLAAPTHGAVR